MAELLTCSYPLHPEMLLQEYMSLTRNYIHLAPIALRRASII